MSRPRPGDPGRERPKPSGTRCYAGDEAISDFSQLPVDVLPGPHLRLFWECTRREGLRVGFGESTFKWNPA